MASEGQRELDGDHGRGRRTHGAISRRQARTVHSHLNANCKILNYSIDCIFSGFVAFYTVCNRFRLMNRDDYF